MVSLLLGLLEIFDSFQFQVLIWWFSPWELLHAKTVHASSCFSILQNIRIVCKKNFFLYLCLTVTVGLSFSFCSFWYEKEYFLLHKSFWHFNFISKACDTLNEVWYTSDVTGNFLQGRQGSYFNLEIQYLQN